MSITYEPNNALMYYKLISVLETLKFILRKECKAIWKRARCEGEVLTGSKPSSLITEPSVSAFYGWLLPSLLTIRSFGASKRLKIAILNVVHLLESLQKDILELS
jgi:hypothetical protein